MARLSGDDDSWRASGLRKRYADWEHEHRPPMKKKGKNKKRWCKGKVGREHAYEAVPYKRAWMLSDAYLIDKCSKCGREENFRRNPKYPAPRWWA
jgi:hypothetical protein